MKAHFALMLAPLDRDDCVMIRRWRNDYRIYRWCRQDDMISDVAQAAWYDRMRDDPATRMYRIDMDSNGHVDPVGVAGLTGIDWLNRRAEFSLYVAPSFQRRGLGAAALHLLLRHGFETLNLEQIWGECFAGNPALKIFQHMGMRVDGVRRRFYFKDNAWLDATLVSMLKDEWEAIKKDGTARVPNLGLADSGGEQRLNRDRDPSADADISRRSELGDELAGDCLTGAPALRAAYPEPASTHAGCP